LDKKHHWNGSVEGFNHVINYCNFRNKTSYKGQPINIVEGFLVLETRDGEINMPVVDTVEEMYEKFFSHKTQDLSKHTSIGRRIL
jgi:hypothetical protein